VPSQCRSGNGKALFIDVENVNAVEEPAATNFCQVNNRVKSTTDQRVQGFALNPGR
jgi:hypothetical protein